MHIHRHKHNVITAIKIAKLIEILLKKNNTKQDIDKMNALLQQLLMINQGNTKLIQDSLKALDKAVSDVDQEQKNIKKYPGL